MADKKTISTPKSLVGPWYNELGSVMEIRDSTEEGVLVGRFNSTVGNAEGWYELRGTYDKDGSESFGTIGWAVTFNNSEQGDSCSTCTWSGLRKLQLDGNPVIITTWLLTRQKKEDTKIWESTHVNKDYFYRTLPKDEKIQAAPTAQNSKEPASTKSD